MPKRFPAGTSPVRDRLAMYLRKHKGKWVESNALAMYMYGDDSLASRRRCTALVNLTRRDDGLPYVIDTWHRGKNFRSYYRLRDRLDGGSAIIGTDADFLKTDWRVVQESTRRMSTASRTETRTARKIRALA